MTPQATIFDFATPATVDAGDAERGRARRQVPADFAGTVTGVRFYKAAANTGTHIGSLWSAGRHAARPGDVQQRDRSGWQNVMFSSPVADHRRHDLRGVLLRARTGTTR